MIVDIWNLESKKNNKEREVREYEEYFAQLQRKLDYTPVHRSDAHLVAVWREEVHSYIEQESHINYCANHC